jgi:predicted nucleotide-binding protein
MYYHAAITARDSTNDEIALDLSEAQLDSRVVGPYDRGQTIIINGRSIVPSEILRLKVYRSGRPSAELAASDRARDAAAGIIFLPGPSDAERATSTADDVTDAYVKGPPGSAAAKKPDTDAKGSSGSVTPKKTAQRKSRKKVFVVHGHDEALKNSLELLLHEFKLQPIVLHRQPDEGLTVEEKLERNSDVDYAFVLLTPDEIAYSIEKANLADEERQAELRPRPNVLYELGFFVGKLGRSKVCCIAREGVEIPSDLKGLVLKSVKHSAEEVAYALLKELKKAGLKPSVE